MSAASEAITCATIRSAVSSARTVMTEHGSFFNQAMWRPVPAGPIAFVMGGGPFPGLSVMGIQPAAGREVHRTRLQ